MSEEWNGLNEDGKKKYQEVALADKARYEREMSEYKNKNQVVKA